MMMKVNRLLAFLFFCSALFTYAQVDGIKPLGGNSILMNYKKPHKGNAQKSTAASRFLPFLDDFSYPGPYAADTLWEKYESVFVNRGYAIAPPTIGAATFDGLNRVGYPYNISATSGSFLSDTLLSVPIRLDYTDATLANPITPADSVYLSFYYQAKGRGDTPEQNDVLNLFFFAPGDSLNFTTGNLVWSKGGYNLGLNVGDTGFHRVMIPIYRSEDDTIFFQDTAAIKTGFRFAFVNWGTQCGAIDHWHIDQVYLQKGRTFADTVFPDVSFVYDEQSLLKNYSQMPYNQFAGASDMKDSMNAILRNNYNVKSGNTWNGAVVVNTEYQILNSTGTQINLTTCGTNNVFNYDSIGYCKDRALIHPSLGGFTYNSGAFPDTTSFLYKFYVNGATTFNGITRNDTACFRQEFKNYYSYDDGTAEGGYFVSAYEGEMAVKYKLNVADTLRALDIYFDPIMGVNLLQNMNIKLGVWGDNNGMPYNTIFMDSLAWHYPTYLKSGYDVFVRYQLSKNIPLAAGTTFYVGTYQVLNTPLGIGYDLNTDTHKNVFYFDGISWHTSTVNGSLMVHPVFGDSLSTVGIKSFATEKENVRVYPNPATDEIFISSSENLGKITISDLLGNILIEKEINSSTNQQINTAVLPNGLYLLRTFNAKGSGSTQKLIISR